MKRLLIGLFIIAVSVGVVACGATADETTTNSTDVTTEGQDVVLDSNPQIFAVEALSASSLMDSSVVSDMALPLALPLADVTTTEPSDDTVISSDELTGVDKYLNMMQDFLGTNNGLGVTQTESDLPDYQYKVVFDTVDLAGNAIQYVMYYNETVYSDTSDTSDTSQTTTDTQATTTDTQATTTEESTDQTTVRGENFYFADSDDSNVLYSITGIIISGDIQYNVEVKKIVDANNAEIMRLRAFIDKDNFTLVNYKTDTDGMNKFFYENVVDGKVVTRSNVRVFEDDTDLKVLLNITDGDSRGRYLFNIETEDNVQYIHINYNVRNADGTFENGNVHIVATTDPTTGEVVYEYKVLSQGQDNANKGLNKAQYAYNKEFRHRGRGNTDNPSETNSTKTNNS